MTAPLAGPLTTRRPRCAAPRRSWLVVALGSGVAALAVVGGSAAPAVGHGALTGSAPADGAVVAVPPAAVELTFTEPPLEMGTEIQVTAPDGQVVDDGEVVRSAATVTQPIADGLPAGRYEVVWRVTSADGHPVSGELSFTAEAPGIAAADAAEPDPAAPDATDADAAEVDPAREDGTADTAAGDVDPQPGVEPGTGLDDPAPGEDAEGWDAVPWVVGVVVLVVAGVVVWAIRRRGAGQR